MLYPDNMPLPDGMRTDLFVLRPLRAADNALDYAAVMASQATLRAATLGAWPRNGFTPAENLRDLEEHEADHVARTSFTFTIMNPAETECLGCIYIFPVEELFRRMIEVPLALAALPAYTPALEWWMLPACVAADMDLLLIQSLRTWFADAWPWKRMLYATTFGADHQQQILQRAGLPLFTAAPTKYGTLYIHG